MRLGAFILQNTEAIVAEWEVFARTCAPGAKMDKLALRDHAEDILRAAARDMASRQTEDQRADKSKGGGGADDEAGRRLDGASAVHAVGRVHSGFDLPEVVAEYRALRASVLRLWRQSLPDTDHHDIDDITRFNEAIDQSLGKAVGSYTGAVDRSRQMFLAILGHDLRQPLNSITMSAFLLATPGRLDAEAAAVAGKVSSAAAAMARLITDLLDFTSTGLGAAIPVAPAPTDLGRICREVMDELGNAHPARTLRFESGGDVCGNWDAARLRQVVSNLAGNAVQHADGAVLLTAAGEADHVTLAVHNRGTPIPPGVLPTIFDPLTRGAASQQYTGTAASARGGGGGGARRPSGSIGLGLYIAREIVHAHGGTIDVASTPEAGTTFTVRLPRRHLAGAAAPPHA